MEGSEKCFFCGRPVRKDSRFLRSESRIVCEKCLAEFETSQSSEGFSNVAKDSESSPDNSLDSPSPSERFSFNAHSSSLTDRERFPRYRMDVSSSGDAAEESESSTDDSAITSPSHSQISISGRSSSIIAETRASLGRTYSILTSDLLKGCFPGMSVSVNVIIDEEDGALRRVIEVRVEGTFQGDEIEIAEIVLRRSLSLAEGDRIWIFSSGPPEIFDAFLPSGRRWVFRLSDISRKEADKLLKWNVYRSRKQLKTMNEHDQISLVIKSVVGDALREFVENYGNPECAYRYAMITALSGYLDRCRQALVHAATDPRFAAEAANILSMIEVEDRAGKGIEAAIGILRRELPSHPVQESMGKVLHCNLARLLEVKGELKSAEKLYRIIFDHDWYFLDVRERLRRLSPEAIASAQCAKNLRILNRAVSYWHRSRGFLPGALQDLVPAFLSSLPACPVSGSTYEYEIVTSSFKVWCSACQRELICSRDMEEPESPAGPGSDSSVSRAIPEDRALRDETQPGSEETKSIAQSYIERECHRATRTVSDDMDLMRQGPGKTSDLKRSAGGVLKDRSGDMDSQEAVAEQDAATRQKAAARQDDEAGFDDEAGEVMAWACTEAHRMGVSYVGTEHILLGILKTVKGRMAGILKKAGIRISKVRAEVKKKTIEDDEAGTKDLVFTRFARQAIIAAFNVLYPGARRKVGTVHLLLGIVTVSDGLACEAIRSCGADIEAMRAEIVQMLLKERHQRLKGRADESKDISASGKKIAEDVETGLPLLSRSAEWRIVEARETEYLAVYDDEDSLKISETDFLHRTTLRSRAFGSMLYTCDSDNGIVYYKCIILPEILGMDPRALSSSHSLSTDLHASEIEFTVRGESISDKDKEAIASQALDTFRPSVYSVSISKGDKERITQAPRGYDFKGILSLSPDGSTLITFMTQSDRPSCNRDNPRLAFITVSSGKLVSVPFEMKGVFPEDIRFGPVNEILSLVPPGDLRIFNFLGLMQYSFAADGFVRGASFHPSLNKVAIGMQGIGIWDLSSGDIEWIVHYGSYPTWSPDGSHIWFRKNDSTLCAVDVKTNKVKVICSLRCVEHPVMLLSSRLLFSPCGRYLFCALSAGSGWPERSRACGDEEKKADEACNGDFLCILDTEKKLIWSAPGRSQGFCWIRKGAPAGTDRL